MQYSDSHVVFHRLPEYQVIPVDYCYSKDFTLDNCDLAL